MATNPLTFTLTPGMAPAAPIMRLLSRFDRQKVEAFVEIGVALLDYIDPDPDAEDGDPLEANGNDMGDQAWIEWHTMRGSQKGGSNILAGHEDDEESDPPEDDDPAEDDDPLEPNGDEQDFSAY